METFRQRFAHSDCQRRVLDGLSFFADGDLRDAPLDTSLENAGIRGSELGIVERNVNAVRRERDESPLPSGTIKNATRPNSRWWDGSSSGLDMRNIGAAGPSMSFDVA